MCQCGHWLRRPRLPIVPEGGFASKLLQHCGRVSGHVDVVAWGLPELTVVSVHPMYCWPTRTWDRSRRSEPSPKDSKRGSPRLLWTTTRESSWTGLRLQCTGLAARSFLIVDGGPSGDLYPGGLLGG